MNARDGKLGPTRRGDNACGEKNPRPRGREGGPAQNGANGPAEERGPTAQAQV